MAAGADFLVTGDKKHLQPLKTFRGVRIVSPRIPQSPPLRLGVGYTRHADLAVERRADAVVVINPVVPLMVPDGERRALKARGLYTIMEQAGRITSQHLLDLGLRDLQQNHPKVEFFLFQPEPKESPLFGHSMGFDASRAALRFGYATTREWLQTKGALFIRRFAARAAAQRASA